jgi:aspartate racemase
MKSLGIIGGIGPESTVEYYRLLVAAYRQRKQDGSYPLIVINSIDMTRMLALIGAGDLVGVTAYLLGEVRRLAAAGVDVGLMASNTPHVVFEEINCQSPIPLISIVETACAAVKDRGLTQVGLFGTRFTMQGDSYSRVFSNEGIALITPASKEQEYIHDKYMNELVNGVFLPETKRRMLKIVDRMVADQAIQGLVLGGTELPLLLTEESHRGIPFFDTTRIHVEHAVTRLLE